MRKNEQWIVRIVTKRAFKSAKKLLAVTAIFLVFRSAEAHFSIPEILPNNTRPDSALTDINNSIGLYSGRESRPSSFDPVSLKQNGLALSFNQIGQLFPAL